MLRRFLLILLCLLSCSSACGEAFVFGASESGRDLVCHSIGSADASQSILLTFAVHGFEGARDHDGEVLVEIAQNLIDHYSTQPESLSGYVLHIIPCVNPDGLLDGTGEYTVGRLNAKELDINRDFPERWTRKTNAKHRTGDAPFATAEARAVRDLTGKLKPTYAVDVHGWINGVYGDKALCSIFHDAFGFPIRNFSDGGMLAQWMDTVTEGAVMVELPHRPGRENYAADQTEKMIEALDALMNPNRPDL